MAGMKHAGKAHQAALKLILWTFLGYVAVVAAGFLAAVIGSFITGAAIFLFALWGLLAIGIYFYFRDPDPAVPLKAGVLVAPVQGTVEAVEEEIGEVDYMDMDGPLTRVIVRIGFTNVPVHYAMMEGEVGHLKHSAGDFHGSTDRTKETLDLRIDHRDGEAEISVGFRAIAGRVGKRIQSWVSLGEAVECGQRIGLMQFGYRCEIYLPPQWKVRVREDDSLQGGETVIAELA